MNSLDAIMEAIEKLNRRIAALETTETTLGATLPNHAVDHENGGGDEIDVAGLSGVLADDQNPVAHASDHQQGGADSMMPLTVLQLSSTSQTISGGVITATSSFVVLDTEGGAASDDLDTINGLDVAGAIIVLKTTASTRDVVLKNGSGNLDIGADFTMATVRDTAMLIRTAVGSNWRRLGTWTN